MASYDLIFTIYMQIMRWAEMKGFHMIAEYSI